MRLMNIAEFHKLHESTLFRDENKTLKFSLRMAITILREGKRKKQEAIFKE